MSIVIGAHRFRDEIDLKLSSSGPKTTKNSSPEWSQRVLDLIQSISAKKSYHPEWGRNFSRILQEGDPNQLSGQGCMPNPLFKVAKRGGPVEFVQICYDAQVDFNRQEAGSFGNTALMWAIANGRNEMAAQILEFDQDVNLQANIKHGRGNTALHISVGKGYTDVTRDGQELGVSNVALVRKIVAKKASANIKNIFGHTALHLACIRKDPDMIEALIESGVDTSIKTSNGETCEELLDTSWLGANRILKETVVAYLLPKADFETKKEKCRSLLQSARQKPKV